MAVRTYDGLFVDRAPLSLRTPSGLLTSRIYARGHGYDGNPDEGGGDTDLPTLPEPGDTVPEEGDISPGGLTRDESVVGLKVATFFDGSTMLTNLPSLPSNCTKFALSCWVYQEGGQGVLFDTNQSNPDFLDHPIVWNSGESASAIAVGTDLTWSNGGTDPAGPWVNFAGGARDGSNNAACHASGAFDWDASEALIQWQHFMMSGRTSANLDEWLLTCWIDDVDIFTNLSNLTINSDPELNQYSYGPDYIWPSCNLSVQSYSSAEMAMGSEVHPQKANIGGNRRDIFSGFPQSDPAGDGLRCGVAEYWLSFDQHIAWENGDNRYKFHNAPIGIGQKAPVNLGPSGARPTGHVPHVYLRGGALTFFRNQARAGTPLSITGALQTLLTAP